MSSSALAGSVISPLRTPRERAWPRPTMFSALSADNSPTTAQTFDVPISRPTMIVEEGSNMFLLWAQRFGSFGRGRRNQRGFQPFDRNVVADREIDRPQRFADLASFLLNLRPAAELLLEITTAESNFTAIRN